MSPRPASANISKLKSTQSENKVHYRRQFASIAKTICELGATCADLARAFEVDEATIKHWQVRHKDFAEACQLGAEHADERVEQSQYQRAVGYDYKAQKVVTRNGKTVIVEHSVHVPADVSAGQFWLTNRRPDRWRVPGKIQPPPSDESNILMQMADALNHTGKRPKEY